ncbi:MAG: hypothetical protein GC182_22330 [Rhodopseudomonas sp.]|nr:hypothetical protein [Rhodopseudomonas sp.]
MHRVSLIVEFLRGRPRLVFWAVALTQALLWTLVPTLFYAAPPSGLPITLAVGHEFMLGSYLGPPLAFWAGELAFRLAGLLGVYALSQFCIVVALWAVFTLGRAVVGTRHAVIAILMMVGIAVFTVPSPDFGPAVLAAPFWALALLHYWRAVALRQRGAWFLLALDLGLLLLTSFVGLILPVLLIGFTLATARGRQALRYPEPFFGLALFVIVVLPFAGWLYGAREFVVSEYAAATGGAITSGLRLCIALVVAHLGLVLLVALASGWPRRRRERAPEIDRAPVEPFARHYVYFFALVPALVAIVAVLADRQLLSFATLGSYTTLAPLVLLSGLAAVLAVGDQVVLYRERLVSSAWLALLVVPPLLVVLSLAVMPWTFARDAVIAQPAGDEARFFADNYHRRIGKPLAFVTGDERLAPAIALLIPERPRVFFAWAPRRSPWATVDDVATQGAVLVWPADKSNAAPADLATQFPGLVPELPHDFIRAVQGRLPPIRLGWSVLRPRPTP